MSRGLFVTGTGTGVGKTFVTGAICAALRARGEHVVAHKPVVTGVDEPDPGVPMDHELLGRLAGLAPEAVAPLRFGPAVSPHLAAELAGTRVDPDTVLAAVPREGDPLVVEGVGGLLVPLGPDWTVRDLAVALALPLVVVAAAGLGTINHTLLTVESARAAGLDVRGVVLSRWPATPTALERSNRATIARLGEVAVATLPELALDPAAFAAAGEQLPLDAWLAA